jgi:hypothetical protein
MSKTYKIGIDQTSRKQKAEANVVTYIRSLLRTKRPFMDFDYIYGTGVLFKPLTREEVEEIYNTLK